MAPPSTLLAIFFSALAFLLPVLAVRRGDFKTCAQAGFCRRNRDRASRASSPEFASTWKSPYRIRSPPAWIKSTGTLEADLVNDLFPAVSFRLAITFLKSAQGTLRLKLDELNGLRQRYNEADRWAMWKKPRLLSSADFDLAIDQSQTVVSWGGGTGHNYQFILRHEPLLVTLLKDGQPHVVLNERGLLNMEHFRRKPSDTEKSQEGLHLQNPEPSAASQYPGFPDPTQDGMWEEDFGGRTDSKPKGPESLSLDITFPGYTHVYGIPEHASPLSLKTTRNPLNNVTGGPYSDPYRLWNLDVFEFESDSEMALYGAIPFMKAHRAGSTVGVFWLNAAETWVDIEKSKTQAGLKRSWDLGSKSAAGDRAGDRGPTDVTTTTHWISESGIMDLFIFLGPTSKDIFASFGALVGTTALPPYFSIAHHQCRWNYVNQEDVLSVIRNFDKFDIPLDVLWLDIEYAEEHKYFVWDKKNFPNPLKMIGELESTGRKLVTIVDPHIKRTKDLYVYKEAVDLNVLCKLPDGSEFEGWCWTGSSSWVDYFDPKSWDWWAGLYKFNKFRESTVNVHSWLDMNEPSVFNAPEITMPRDNIHFGGWEHRDLHNINGMASHNHSSRGLRERTDPPMRGFVLSRAFFAGTQRYGAIWHGDNQGTWNHLAVSIPMLLSNSIAGMAFNGADVGGFFGNPSHELLVRWYQTGAFFPFFRAHAHIDTKRREPYLFDEPIRGYLVSMIRLRYSLLPTWYTCFFENTFTGAPMTVPQYVMFPDDEAGFEVDDQYYLGTSGLLVKPVTKEGAAATEVYLADEEPYYNYFTHDLFQVQASSGSSKKFYFPAPLDTLPLFIRGGHIFSRRDLIRRAASLTLRDPITLVVALNKKGEAEGTLYLDDGESFDHERGQFAYRAFSLKKVASTQFKLSSTDAVANTLKSTPEELSSVLESYRPGNEWIKRIQSVTIEKIIVLGLSAQPRCVRKVGQSEGLSFDFKPGLAHDISSVKSTGPGKTASKMEINNANLEASSDWSIELELGSSCPVSSTSIESDPLVVFQSPQCSKGYFLCKNEGHIPSCIRISRVNDGICEPECCDGSDEARNTVKKCPNRCEAVGVEHREKRAKQMLKFQAGRKERQNYISFGMQEQARLKNLIKSLQVDLISLKAKERDAKALLEVVEKTSEAEVNKLKQTDLFKKITEFQATIKTLDQRNQKLQKGLDQLSHILTDLKGGYNPNYQDMAVKGAVKGFEEWETSKEDDETDGDDDDPDVDRLLKEDPVALVNMARAMGASKTFDSNGVSMLESYLPETLRPTYEGLCSFLLEASNKVGMPRRKVDLRGSGRSDVSGAAAAHEAAQTAVTDAQKKLDDASATLNKDWGAEWEFKKLDQTCLEIPHGDYTYELCVFGEAFQKSAGGGRTSLGRFAHWNTDAAHGSPEYYGRQVYLNGAKCWNGPERSVKVELKCGAKNALYSVMEPEKCEYWFKVTTPAVCYDGLPDMASAAGTPGREEQSGDENEWVVVRDEL